MADARLPALTGGDAQRVLAGKGALRINMHWSPVAPPTGPVRAPVFDVDLGCLYELADRSCGVVQYLGSLRGAFERPPFVQLDRDDRAGSAAGENLFVNLDRTSGWRRILVFCYAHNGPLANARIDIEFRPSGGDPSFRIAVDRIPATAHACAVALVSSEGGWVTVRREVRYVPGFQQDLDRVYGFGLRWGRADKPGLR